MEASREVRNLRPHVKIVWGGYFPSIYPDAALNAKYVDYVVRGQGEDTLIELLDAVRGKRSFDSILGLSYKDSFGLHRNNPERPMKGPGSFPWSPFHRVPVQSYLRPSFFGKRTAVHHASVGCPFNCSFCGVHAAYGREEKMESPQRTVAILKHLVDEYGIDSVQFYDMNFFLGEDHARELCELLAPLQLRWWCEARVDIMSRYSDEKLIRLTFERPVAPNELAPFGAATMPDETHAVIRVPRDESARRAGEMLTRLPVADVTIDEVEADEVIRQMFAASAAQPPASKPSPPFRGEGPGEG